MKLSHEEIKEASKQCDWCHLSSFIAGARFAESRLLPFVEANDYLIIDTAEKRKAYEPFQIGDEYWCDGEGWVRGAGACTIGNIKPFGSNHIYRRPIRWHKVSETPIPKDVPVWLIIPEYPDSQLRYWTPERDCERATHWRYAQIPTPPPIDKERERFDAWNIATAAKWPSHRLEKKELDYLFECWQAAQSAARKEGK